jgi:hypothetical protein
LCAQVITTILNHLTTGHPPFTVELKGKHPNPRKSDDSKGAFGTVPDSLRNRNVSVFPEK